MNLLDIALSYHQTGEFAKAEKIYRQLLEINPSDANTLHLMSILSAQQGELHQALFFIDAALAIDPLSPTFHNSKGNILGYLESYDEAIVHYERAIELKSTAPTAYNNLANLYLKKEDYPKAISHYQTAILLKPDYADAYYNLGIIFAKVNRRDEAIEHLQKAVALLPAFHEAHNQLGQLLQEKGQLEEALKHYHLKLEYDSYHVRTLVNIGAVLVKQGDLLQGIQYFQKALEINPNFAEAHYNLGSTFLSLQKTDESLTHFLQAAQEKPEANTYFNIGVLYMYKDKYNDAIESFTQALSIEPNHLESHLNLGALYLKLAYYPKAIEHYQLAQTIQPENKEILYILSAITEQQDVPRTAPPEFITHLFDHYATHFEKHLTQFLNYQAHHLLYKYVREELAENLDYLFILELGCGTGLCGALFKPHAKKLIGIDLSDKMLKIAAEKNIYDELIHEDLLSALGEQTNVDLIIAADVFGYSGDLHPTFSAVHRALKNKGIFAFTLEATPTQEQDYVLQKSTRFAHSENYIERLCVQYHFNIRKHTNVELRTERQVPVKGYVYILEAN